MLKNAIDSQIKLLKQEKEDDNNSVPNGLISFLDSPKYHAFLLALLEYCRELFRLENKQAVLEQEAKQRGFPVPQVLPSEKKKLNEKAKSMANAYSWIVFQKRSISDKAMNSCHSFMQFKSKILANQKHDEFFYESILLFSVKALKDAFEVSDLQKLEEEVSRLFRSNAFNITERRLNEEARVKQYPQLAELQGKQPSDEEIKKKLMLRSRVPKESGRVPLNKTKSEIRPLYNRMTPHAAIFSRSPMVSLIFPSVKDKIRIF